MAKCSCCIWNYFYTMKNQFGTVNSPHFSFVKPNTHPFYLNSDRNSLIQPPAYNDYKGTHLIFPLSLWLAAVNEQPVPSYTTSLEKPLAPGHHMLHKKNDCSFRGKKKLRTFSALLLLYGTRPGNSSAGQFAGLQSNWWNSSFPSFLEAPCKWRGKKHHKVWWEKKIGNVLIHSFITWWLLLQVS